MTGSSFQIGVLASGGGTTLQAVIDACGRGDLDASVAIVISNNSRSGAAQRAVRHNIPFTHLSTKTHPDDAQLDSAIRDALVASDVDLVLLAGYMKKLGPTLLKAFAGKMVNTHPALLPKFGGQGMYGSNVHAAVLAAGETETGISVHLVEGEYDTGRILAQHRVAVQAGDDVDSLTARVQRDEKIFLIQMLQRIASGEMSL